MAEPQHKIGDVVIADKIGGDQSISAIREILITKDGKIFYFLADPSVGYAEENIRLADSQLNQYDRLFRKSREDYNKLLADFRAVAKVLADKNPELGNWLLCNWGSELSGHI